jgi:hypothetical protein
MDTIKDRTEPSRRIENFFGGEGGGCPKGADQYESSVPPSLQFFTKIKNYFLPSGVFGMIKYFIRRFREIHLYSVLSHRNGQKRLPQYFTVL